MISAFLRGGSVGVRSLLLRSARLALCIGLVPVFAVGCGARSELLPGQEPCAKADSTRVCSDVCGQGEQVCTEGAWQPCQVAPTQRGCVNQCGTGTEVCLAGAWGGCEVPEVSMACNDLCGAGSKTCTKGAWGTCVVPVSTEECSTVCGKGEQICKNGKMGACSAPLPKPPKLQSTVRDFSDVTTSVVKKHPDFELPLSGNFNEPGLVLPLLGPDDKPVYANRPGSQSTSGQANFDQWYNDTPGINISAAVELPLLTAPDNPGLFMFTNDSFFPIDGQLWGNGTRAHNFHFTLESNFEFHYIGREVFRFRGDDDLWVFVNRHLAIDLGGIHARESGEVQLDQVAAQFGMTKGNTYRLHLFFAERHTQESHFAIETTIADPGTCE